MKLVDPVTIGDAQFVSSTVAEADNPAWSAATTYAANALVMRAHRNWQSLIASNLNHDPVTSPAQWTDMGPTNRFAMFDEAVGTATSGTGEIDVVLAPGPVNGLAVLDTNAETVTVSVTLSGTTIYSRTQTTNVSGSVIEDWYDYFFTPVGKLSTLTFLDLPSIPTAQVTVSIVGPDPHGPVKVGTLLVGNIVELGSTEVGAGVGITDYSVKTTSAFGGTTVAERAWAKRMTAKAMIDSTAVDGVQRALAAVRARPVLWIAEEGYDSLTVYGFFKDFSVDLTYPNISYVSFTIEGLI
jgi:hypothetical protein